jgi:hypothetical protein
MAYLYHELFELLTTVGFLCSNGVLVHLLYY